MSPLSVPNFIVIGARIRVIWRILQSVRNEDEEEKDGGVYFTDRTGPSYRKFLLSKLGV